MGTDHRRSRRGRDSGSRGDFAERYVWFVSESRADQRLRTVHAQQTRRTLARELGTHGRIGVGMIGAMRIADPGQRGTLPGDLRAALDTQTAAEQRDAVDALAHHRGLVDVSNTRLVARLRRDAIGDAVRKDVLPYIPRWAVRMAWHDVQSAALNDPALRSFSKFARSLRGRARAHMVSLLRNVVKDQETFAALVLKVRGRSARELAMVTAFGPVWREKATVMLRCSRSALRTRRWRAKNRDARKGPAGK
jgi:hypothetical protein